MRTLTLVLVALALCAARGAAASVDPFAGDDRFRQPVTLAAREQPLEAFLEGLRKSQRLPVRADASTRDERISLFCRARPAGEVLAAVARHLDYTWIRRRQGEQENYL